MNGLCGEQVDRLVELGGAWPPILMGSDGQVIDGGHRVAAARRLGMTRMAAACFDGAVDEAFVEFVRRNVVNGLVLSLAERKDAARRVLRQHPVWSDRRIAEICALSPKTIGRLRQDVVCDPTDDSRGDEMREGRDHRLRPVRQGSVRSRVVEALREQPGASLRTIAASVGVSPETVRLVRLNLASNDVEPAAEPAAHDAPHIGEPVVLRPSLDESWRTDAALASSDRGDDFVAWMSTTQVERGDLEWAQAVPMSRVYVVASEARRRAELWSDFAQALEARPAKSQRSSAK